MRDNENSLYCDEFNKFTLVFFMRLSSYCYKLRHDIAKGGCETRSRRRVVPQQTLTMSVRVQTHTKKLVSICLAIARPETG